MEKPDKLSHQDVKRTYAEAKNRMVRKLLALGYNLGWDKPESRAEQEMERSRRNVNHVNRWLLSDKSTVKKTINNLTYNELTKVITQLEIIYKDTLTKI